MVKIVWSPQSLDDLEGIAEYIAKDSTFYASSFVGKIVDAVQKIASFPKIGRKVPEANDERVREILYKQYRIIYQHLEESVEILTIFHSSRLFDM